MTTAQHRTAALAAAAALNWIEAAEHYEAAIAKHPAHKKPRGIGEMDQMDMDSMKARAASFRRFADQQAAA